MRTIQNAHANEIACIAGVCSYHTDFLAGAAQCRQLSKYVGRTLRSYVRIDREDPLDTQWVQNTTHALVSSRGANREEHVIRMYL